MTRLKLSIDLKKIAQAYDTNNKVKKIKGF